MQKPYSLVVPVAKYLLTSGLGGNALLSRGSIDGKALLTSVIGAKDLLTSGFSGKALLIIVFVLKHYSLARGPSLKALPHKFKVEKSLLTIFNSIKALLKSVPLAKSPTHYYSWYLKPNSQGVHVEKAIISLISVPVAKALIISCLYA